MYKGNLTKIEALKAMKEGQKVGREYFSQEEYIHFIDGVMKFEDGVSAYPEWWNAIEPGFSQPEDGKAFYIFNNKLKEGK